MLSDLSCERLSKYLAFSPIIPAHQTHVAPFKLVFRQKLIDLAFLSSYCRQISKPGKKKKRKQFLDFIDILQEFKNPMK